MVRRLAWLIEAGVYGEEADALRAEIRRQGMTADLVPHRALLKGRAVAAGGRQLEDGDAVLGYGTFPFTREIQLNRRWTPGAWCNPANLDCAAYFGPFGPFLLNQRHVLLPGVEAIREADRLFESFGRSGAVFARPAGCAKTFTGRCLSRGGFASALGPTRYDPTTRVVIAAPRAIGREWRLVVAGDRVIAASRYAVSGRKDVDPGCPAEVRAFAEAILRAVRWRPDPIFMLDVCESEGNLSVVELNGFSCSWLYRCDLGAVVAAAAELAGG